MRNESAFPRPASTASGTTRDGDEQIEPQSGLTKREWFAGIALQGMLSADLTGDKKKDVADAWEYADLMIAASQRPPAKEGA